MGINRVEQVDDLVPLRSVLISVADKSGLEAFVPGLVEVNPEIKLYSTGGTYATIKEILGASWAINLGSVAEYTGQPEMQGGLVKTLDFRIYLGLLSETYNEHHRNDLERTGSTVFDMVVGNLYPFAETVATEGATAEDARGNIDIGGPCMLRAAAKNYLRVAAVCNPQDYTKILSTLRKLSGKLDLETRFECAKAAFAHTAEYDARIADYLAGTSSGTAASVYVIQNSARDDG